MPAKYPPLTPSQDSLLCELSSKVARLKKELRGLIDRIEQDVERVSEKRVIDLKNLKKELENKYVEVETSLMENLGLLNKRMSQAENVEYGLKYQQAKGLLLTKEQIEKIDEDVKSLERPLSLESADLTNLRFRVVMDMGDSNYPNIGEEQLKRQRLCPKDLDLIAENSKLESIIEQYRTHNERLERQIEEIKTYQGSGSILISVFRGYLDDLKTRLSAESQKLPNKLNDLRSTLEKAMEAIDCKEEKYLKECLKEIGDQLVSSKYKLAEFEQSLKSSVIDIDKLKKERDLLQFQLDDVMRTAQVICNPEQDQPVNLYMMKMELRNKLKVIEDTSNLTDTGRVERGASEMGERDKENRCPNRPWPPVVNLPPLKPVQSLSNYSTTQTVTSKPLQMKSIAVQSDFRDQEIFPALDYRKCVRCGKNDVSSPGLCRYLSTSAESDLSGASQGPALYKLKSKERVAKEHVYPVDTTKYENSLEGALLCVRKDKGQTLPSRNASAQTIVGLVEISQMKGGREIEVYRHVDPIFLSPRDHR
jgi:hypothetical protein